MCIDYGKKYEFGDITWYPSIHTAVYRCDNRVPLNASGDGVMDFLGFQSNSIVISQSTRAAEKSLEKGSACLQIHLWGLEVSSQCVKVWPNLYRISCSWASGQNADFRCLGIKVMDITLAFKLAGSLVRLVAGQPARQPPVVSFNTFQADENDYRRFLENIREVAASGEESHGIPVMRNPDTVPNNERYFFVQLQNVRGSTITLALDITDLYVVGYRAGDQSYFFRNHFNAASPYVFTDTRQNTLPFGSLYENMERDARNTHNSGRNERRRNEHGRNDQEVSRETIDLGLQPLNAAITRLHDYDRPTLARSLIVIIQMVSEAARYRYIQQRVLLSIQQDQNFRPDPAMLGYENSWGHLCEAVQLSNAAGQFPQDLQIVLQRPNNTDFYVRRVTPTLIQNLLIMRFAEREQVNHRHDL